ncbi:MAG: DNA polymerase III subunit epsilon [Holosporaceae bacterium]|jgi:DNA polymerase-3 subunit epsilon|nr:DNA polymerase III subunit epsilon [Holosporaceae bacterium]
MNFPNNLREVVLDTETTGLSHENGDRIVDIGCVELINHVQSGKIYQVYINPQRKMSAEATTISGITSDFLIDKPLFHEIVDDFLSFVGNSRLIIHNAKFDIGFLNSELKRIGKPLFNLDNVIDTLEMARKKFPGSPANLDALCKRFGIDKSSRVTHGSLIDSRLLAEVYMNLLGGHQSSILFSKENSISSSTGEIKKKYPERFFPPSADEVSAHEEFLASLNSPVWNQR